MEGNQTPPTSLSRHGSFDGVARVSRTGSVVQRMTPTDHELTEKIIGYLVTVAPELLSCSAEEFEGAVRVETSYEKIARFASDASCPVLLVAKYPNHNGSGVALYFRLDVNYDTNAAVSFAVIKRTPRWESVQEMAGQILLLSFVGNTPYETAHAYLHNALTPYLTSVFMQSKSANEHEKDNKLSSVKRQLADLELKLLNLQQDTEIPDTVFRIHPDIETALAQAQQSGITETSDMLRQFADVPDNLLRELETNVKEWQREIEKITSLDHDLNIKTATLEVNFWLNLEKVLSDLLQRLSQKDIDLTIAILKHHGYVIWSRHEDSIKAVEKKQVKANEYNRAMSNLPLNDLIAATTLDQMFVAIPKLFDRFNANLNRIKNRNIYDLHHAYTLVAAISQALTDTVFKILEPYPLMKIEMPEFNALVDASINTFKKWIVGVRDFQTKNKQNKVVFAKPTFAHASLATRLEKLRKIRKDHQTLRQVIRNVLTTSDLKGDKAAGIDKAYERFLTVDMTDVSLEGSKAVQAAEDDYNKKIDQIETGIAAKFREQLAVAETSQEMFRIFSKYSPLKVRDRIWGAIQEYQGRLLQRIREDISALQVQFKTGYNDTQAARMSALRDIRPHAGRILWYKQIERQLDVCEKRVSDVLAEGWEQHAQGKKIYEDIKNFRDKIKTKEHIFEPWLEQSLQLSFNVKDRIFSVTDVPGTSPAQQRLSVNYDLRLIEMYKEARNMKCMSFTVPYALMKNTRAEDKFPQSMSLEESVRTYMQAIALIDSNLLPLVGGRLAAVHKLITDGCDKSWYSHKLDAYVQQFSSEMYEFYERVDEIQSMNRTVFLLIEDLATCEFSEDAFVSILSQIQDNVDKLGFICDAKMGGWVQKVDAQVEQRLAVRLSEALALWMESFQAVDEDDEAADMQGTLTTNATADAKGLPVLRHELRVSNQVMVLSPPIECARRNLTAQLHDCLGVICRLHRILEPRLDTSTARTNGPVDTDYRGLLLRLHGDGGSLQDAYTKIDQRLKRAAEYVKTWYNYQALWDMDLEKVTAKLGDDNTMWLQLLVEIQEARRTFDNAYSTKTFGNVVIDYGKVQANVNNKYDSWHKSFLHKYGVQLAETMNDLNAVLQKERSQLEAMTIDTASTAVAVQFIIFVQTLKRKQRSWGQVVASAHAGERLLRQQRFQFPGSWIWHSQLSDEWDAFQDILARKDNLIQAEVAALRRKIESEETSVSERIGTLLTEWDQDKPIHADTAPEVITKTLDSFDARLTQSASEYAQLREAFAALEMQFVENERLPVAIDELEGIKSTWAVLSGIWGKVHEMRDMPWSTVAPRKLRQSLDGLLDEMKGLPNRVRQYAAYDTLRTTLRAYLKANSLIAELKSEALRDRHWRDIQRRLHVTWAMADLRLADVWGVDLVGANESTVRDVLTQAQGEMGLEEFLRMIKDTWSVYEIELVNYQNKTRLAKGWEDIFGKLKEQLSSLNAMRLSPYFKVFADEATAWEEKLNRMHAMLDVWVDVQRTWVYLHGIFSGSADIQHLLPQESNRFSNISAEFLQFMKRVAKHPVLVEVLSFPNVQKQLERFGELLDKVQHALGEYLERERSAFPRFYFVGDEELLEVIGNGRDVGKIQKSFKKMFTGIHAVSLDESDSSILGMVSKEGEQISFLQAVDLSTSPRINEWLGDVEVQMRNALAALLTHSLDGMQRMDTAQFHLPMFLQWLDQYPAQLVVLAVQVTWTTQVTQCLQAGSDLKEVVSSLEAKLEGLASTILVPQEPRRRRKIENIITELVHKRDVTRELANNKVADITSFDWLQQMRFYHDTQQEPTKQLTISIADATFFYGFEYLGVVDKLVQTPLTDRMYLTMTQALKNRLGGSPFGPAGTGKTESVKALGTQLGRFVLVFNCDDKFDFQAMGRIFVGLCQVGAWGCFDEFNRLEERILSAVSQQIQHIQMTLRDSTKGESMETTLMGKPIKINPDMAIFVTMNPGYAGRSNLPDNLKALFRPLAMTVPDRQLIAQVLLFSQGFRTAEVLAKKIVPLYELCGEQLSAQPHYDFGLRSLKSVLVSAGNVKRVKLSALKHEAHRDGRDTHEAELANDLDEQAVIIQSVCETMVPKLVAEDIPLLFSLLQDVFPGVAHLPAPLELLHAAIREECAERHLEATPLFIDKIVQLYQIQAIHHGVMLVGSSGSGKSCAWEILLRALERVDGQEGVSYVIDPKAISKEALYGSLDSTTREWTDGLFTGTMRKIVDNVRNEVAQRHWIVLDGDVDPEWVENLNSVLDDNKILTLPNGERLALPQNVKIMFEVENLNSATPATVSRCGMVWFSNDTVTADMLCAHYINRLRCQPLPADELDVFEGDPKTLLRYQDQCAGLLHPYFAPEGFVLACLHEASTMPHVMQFTDLRVLNALFSMLDKGIRNVLKYNTRNEDLPMDTMTMEKYITKYLIYAIVWSFTGSASLDSRRALGEFIRRSTTVEMPSNSDRSIIDFEVNLESGEWQTWAAKVPTIEVETHKVGAPDVVIPTIDTVRHEELLYTWLADHKPVVLCGPPGSGKTMTLFSALRSLTDMEVVGINFSSATSPELLLKTFDRYCEYKRTSTGTVLSPIQPGKWLVLFCDEINLPDTDAYGTQRVIAFLRQMVERGGFWRPNTHTWVQLERVQFVGACNPPTDPGRKPLSLRFTRHVPVVLVDYPGEESLKQIYRTFNRALLRLFPHLRAYAENVTDAMVQMYLESQQHFTVDDQPHYVYSPRELTRWVRGVYKAIKHVDNLSVEMLVRVWAHEALRLFQDRLLTDTEREWTDNKIDEIAAKWFNDCDVKEALERPILFSNWISKDYVSVGQAELRAFTKARLKVFYEEELDVPLVLFNEVLDHVLRIDRVFRQPQGHLLLIGVSGSGKTTLTRFVAWINGLSIFQVKAHSKYGMDDFDDDLRGVLRRAGCQGEKLCFILDEGNVLDSGFLERINTLLANGEVPGLFDGDDYTVLMTQCKEAAQASGKLIDSNEELYRWFCNEVMKNLHVVFTMNPTTSGLKDRAATSPALFNRCVVDWFGDWSSHALYQVGLEFTNKVDIDSPDYTAPADLPLSVQELPDNPSHREVIVNALVAVHKSVDRKCHALARSEGRAMVVTPRHFLDFINHYVSLFVEKRSELEDQKLHLNIGLRKIDETVAQVEELRGQLSIKNSELKSANEKAETKLQQMLLDQNEAEKRREASVAMQAELAEKELIVRERTHKVESELEQVEPAVAEAREAVSGIRKKQLSEIRSLNNPPAMVKLTMESVCVLLGETVIDWTAVRKVIVRDDFISSIVNFDTDQISRALKNKLEKSYLNNPDYTFENANRASNACGPLLKWVVAQVKYSDMLLRIEPLRAELRALTESAKVTRTQAQETEALVVDLERSIQQYKDEYALLIAEAETLKVTMATVQTKVSRSEGLLHSLSAEQERWGVESSSFEDQMKTIVGDTLLGAAFIVYAGYFDQLARHELLSLWQRSLGAARVQFRDDIALSEYLSTADERLHWQACGLPVDDLCSENAIMLHRFKRYPLTIDPSGQAANFLTKLHQDKKMIVTSFLDNAFRKNLESALRFGNTLLVHDAENFDPILNPVLNRELYRNGGRVLIKIGDQEIDFSPAFSIILCTRNPTVHFAPDVCSRVTFVNFTITRASLQSQCLNAVLKSERPDVDQKRIDLLTLQGDFRRRLRHLEKALLESLNTSKGKILDDDSVITTLESLKREAADINQKFAETDVVTAEVESVRSQYHSLAAASSAVYFSLEQLTHVHFLYQFSLDFFLDIFAHVLHHNANLSALKDRNERLRVIDRDLFRTTYQRVSVALHQRDRHLFAFLLAMIKLEGSGTGDDITPSEYEYFMRGPQASSAITENGDADLSAGATQLPEGVHQCLLQLQESIAGRPFRDVMSHVQNNSAEWAEYLSSAVPEQHVPVCWAQDTELLAVHVAMYRLLVVQATRSDRMLSAVECFVSAVFDANLLESSDLDLAAMVEEEVTPGQPVLLCSVPGYDGSSSVEEIAVGKQLNSIAIGSAEGYVAAEQAISAAAKAGNWILLKNAHLAPEWMEQLEKTKLHTLKPADGFRLFMSMEINSKIAVNLLRMSRIVTLEPPPGIRASLLQTLHGIPTERMDRQPAERSRVYFLLAWLHALVQERLRYAPVGWSKKYEFSESDLRVGLSTVDSWIDRTTGGSGSNIAPERIPWTALKALLSQCIYGGRVDNAFDRHLLDAFLSHLFVAQSFDIDFALVNSSTNNETPHAGVVIPDARNKAEYLAWVEQWSGESSESPMLLGLHANADSALHATLAKRLRTNLQTVQVSVGVGVGAVEGETSAEDLKATEKNVNHRNAAELAAKWLAALPEDVKELRRDNDNIKQPLFRCFEREVSGGKQLLRKVRRALTLVIGVCNGDKQSNKGRALLHDILMATIPHAWRRYTVPVGLALPEWMVDFTARMTQLQSISAGVEQGELLQDIWLGGLMYPEAYITATRQAVAQANKWSLEELSLQLQLDVSDGSATSGFMVTSLYIDGAKPDPQAGLSLDTRGSVEMMSKNKLVWIHESSNTAAQTSDHLTLPLYLNHSRQNLLSTAAVHCSIPQVKVYQRAVALYASVVGK